MQKVTVTVTATHIDDQGITRKIGESYETAKNYAELRKGVNLVDFDGEGKKVEGTPLIHAGVKAATGLTSTAIVNQPDEKEGELVTVDKKQLEAAKAEAAKAEAAKAEAAKAEAAKAEAAKAETAAQKKAREKAEATAKSKEKVEGEFPGSKPTA